MFRGLWMIESRLNLAPMRDEDINLVQPYNSQSTEYSAQYSSLDAQRPVDNRVTVEFSSNENEYIDRNEPDNTL
ncbi:hypothetical protein SUGI_0819350 [Cryptomeria japonica]|nr:hypothetical protein SUGI_0819350 [Cryptomeria japonica]